MDSEPGPRPAVRVIPSDDEHLRAVAQRALDLADKQGTRDEVAARITALLEPDCPGVLVVPAEDIATLSGQRIWYVFRFDRRPRSAPAGWAGGALGAPPK